MTRLSEKNLEGMSVQNRNRNISNLTPAPFPDPRFYYHAVLPLFFKKCIFQMATLQMITDENNGILEQT